MQMVLLESLNALLFLAIRSSTNSKSQTRQEHFGTIHIMVSFKGLIYIELKTISRSATQYCDGLRGVFVVYDPNDPYKNA